MRTATAGLRATRTPPRTPKAHPTKAATATTPRALRRPSRARPESDEETRTTPPLQVPVLRGTRPRAAHGHTPLPQAPAHDALPRRLLRARRADDAAAR